MQIGIAVDNTLPLHIPSFFNFIEAHAKSIKCRQITDSFKLGPTEVRHEADIRQLSSSFGNKLRDDKLSLFITAIPFSNNFFYEGIGGVFIISFSDWHRLTVLPMSNGLAYMVCQIIVKYLMDIGEIHEENTGCVNDFLWDKSGIDISMRAAFLCEKCKAISAGSPHLQSMEYADVLSILNAVSNASRRGVDVLLESTAGVTPNLSSAATSSVFLCHNSQDKPAVRRLNEALRNGGVATWFDEERLQPGEVWQDKLEAAISSIGACLVVVGNSGFGPWQDMERRAFISEFANRGCKIVPVLIGGSERTPELPLFMRQFMWLDLRGDDGRQLARLIGALRG